MINEKIENYFGSSSSEFDHYFGNKIGLTRFYIESNKKNPNINIEEICHKNLRDFISGLKGILEKIEVGQIQEDSKINKNFISEFILLAESIIDPTDENQINKLYEQYHKLSQKG